MKILTKDIIWCIAAACLWIIFSIAGLAEKSLAQPSLSDRELVDALRQGGYNIYFRHAATDWSQDDYVTAEGEWTSCDPQKMRQLSASGRAAARSIGEAIRRLEIPVGRVLSSEYCRTRQTAELMAIGPVKPTRAIMNMRVAGMVGGSEAVIERARKELGRKPIPGTNTVLVAHGNLMRAASGEYTGEAGAAIFKPSGGGMFQLVVIVEPENWQRLANQFAQQ